MSSRQQASLAPQQRRGSGACVIPTCVNRCEDVALCTVAGVGACGLHGQRLAHAAGRKGRRTFDSCRAPSRRSASSRSVIASARAMVCSLAHCPASHLSRSACNRSAASCTPHDTAAIIVSSCCAQSCRKNYLMTSGCCSAAITDRVCVYDMSFAKFAIVRHHATSHMRWCSCSKRARTLVWLRSRLREGSKDVSHSGTDTSGPGQAAHEGSAPVPGQWRPPGRKQQRTRRHAPPPAPAAARTHAPPPPPALPAPSLARALAAGLPCTS